MDNLEGITHTVLEGISLYHYDSFSIGATMKPSMLDRDDQARSLARARGSDSIKTALTTAISRAVSRHTGRVLTRIDPDITILVDMRNGSCQVRSKSVVVQTRYTKSIRGIPQKAARCDMCGMVGCTTCGNGDDNQSIEDMLRCVLLDAVGGSDVRFTWVGGEDRNSLVLGGGRRVYGRIQNPIRRRGPLPDVISATGAVFSEITFAKGLPDALPAFCSLMRVRVRPSETPEPAALRRLHTLAGPILVDNGHRDWGERNLKSLRYRVMRDGDLLLTLEAQGGMPIKRLVNGEGVEPSISGTLGICCTCVHFDILDIKDNS